MKVRLVKPSCSMRTDITDGQTDVANLMFSFLNLRTRSRTGVSKHWVMCHCLELLLEEDVFNVAHI